MMSSSSRNENRSSLRYDAESMHWTWRRCSAGATISWGMKKLILKGVERIVDDSTNEWRKLLIPMVWHILVTNLISTLHGSRALEYLTIGRESRISWTWNLGKCSSLAKNHHLQLRFFYSRAIRAKERLSSRVIFKHPAGIWGSAVTSSRSSRFYDCP